MKPFRFQRFTVGQKKEVFKVGTDGVLLGALVSAEGKTKILEVGAGTGIISLMIAQRNPEAIISAIEINETAANLASENFKNSEFSDRMRVFPADYKDFSTPEKYDLIVSNPPYFEINDSDKDILARQKIAMNFDDLIKKSSRLLNPKGILSVIIPSESSEGFIILAKQYGLLLKRKINIFGILKGVPKRSVLEFSSQAENLVEEDFVIEKSPRMYSDQYLELTKEFHIFGK